MIIKQVIQTCIDEMKELTKVDFCVVDVEGVMMATTFGRNSLDISQMTSFFDSPADSQIIGGNYLFKVKEDDEAVYVLISRGGQTDGYVFGKIAVNELQHLLVAYREKYDHANFMQNLLMDNLLLVDIYNRAKKLGIAPQARRVVFMVEVPEDRSREAQEVIQSLFAEKMDDYVTAIDEKNVILVHTLDDDEEYEDMEQVAKLLMDVMNTEVLVKTRISYGTIVRELRELSKSYKEAKMGLDVGKIFYEHRDIIAYNALGIGRLIYQLPVNLCQIYIQEIFGDDIPKELDDEMLMTINKFYHNNLNVSETARQMYVHRNTLVYRIERLKEATGLDIRTFDDALTLKIALMVVNYMKYLEDGNLD